MTAVRPSRPARTYGKSSRACRSLEGSEEQRISVLAAESDLHPRLIRIALDYAAEHSDEIRERIGRNRDMAERSHQMARHREALLA